MDLCLIQLQISDQPQSKSTKSSEGTLKLLLKALPEALQPPSEGVHPCADLLVLSSDNMAPLFAETDAPLLKTYIMNRLESASEADPDVLSDYILALLRHNQAPAEVMSTCITQLADFMTSGTLSHIMCILTQ